MKQAQHKGDRCVIYCRVSTLKQKQEGLSLEAQEDLCRSYANNNRFTVVKIFSEDESASIAERKKFNEMLAWMKGNNICHLLVEKMDRFHRNMKGEDIIKDHQLTVHFAKPEEAINWQELTAAQKFIFRIQSAQTAYTSDNISEEAIKGMKKKLEQGGVVQYTPIGYLNDKINHKAVKDPDRFHLMRRIFDYALTNKYSIEDLAKIANSIGLTSKSGKPIAKTDIHRTLKNPFYYGMIPWPGKKVDWGRELWPNTGINEDRPPSYPPMITKAEFDKVQDILSGRRNNWTTKRGRDFLFKGLFRCGQCGRSLLGEVKTIPVKGEKISITYYHCSNGFYYVDKNGSVVGKQFVDTKNMVLKAVRSHPEEIWPKEIWPEAAEGITYGKIGDPVTKKRCEGILPWLKEDELEKKILKRLSLITNPAAIDELKKQLEDSTQEFTDIANNQLRQINKRLTEIDGIINRLFERSSISDEDLKTQHDRLKAEREDLKGQQRELEDDNDASVDEAFEFLELSKSLKTRYLAADMDMRHKMLKKVYRTIFVWPRDPDLPDQFSMNVLYYEPFTFFYEEGVIKLSDKILQQEYPKSLDIKVWRGRRDSNSRPPA